MSSVEMFGADREDIQSNKFKSYKGKQDKTDTVGIVFTDKKAMYCGAPTHYKDRYFLCKSTKENKAICCTANYERNNPKHRIGAVIVVYDIGKDPETGNQKLRGYEVMPWIFGSQMYNKLKDLHSEFPLDQHDLKLKCVNEGFQNIDLTPCKTSIWRKNDKLKEQILAQFPAVMEDAKRNLGSNYNIEELKELLGVETPGSEDAAVDVSFGDVVDSI